MTEGTDTLPFMADTPFTANMAVPQAGSLGGFDQVGTIRFFPDANTFPRVWSVAALLHYTGGFLAYVSLYGLLGEDGYELAGSDQATLATPRLIIAGNPDPGYDSLVMANAVLDGNSRATATSEHLRRFIPSELPRQSELFAPATAESIVESSGQQIADKLSGTVHTRLLASSSEERTSVYDVELNCDATQRERILLALQGFERFSLTTLQLPLARESYRMSLVPGVSDPLEITPSGYLLQLTLVRPTPNLPSSAVLEAMALSDPKERLTSERLV